MEKNGISDGWHECYPALKIGFFLCPVAMGRFAGSSERELEQLLWRKQPVLCSPRGKLTCAVRVGKIRRKTIFVFQSSLVLPQSCMGKHSRFVESRPRPPCDAHYQIHVICDHNTAPHEVSATLTPLVSSCAGITHVSLGIKFLVVRKGHFRAYIPSTSM